LVTRPKESLGAAEKAWVMRSPRQALSGPKAFGDQWFIMVDGPDGVKTADHRRRTVGIGEHRGLFSREEKCVLRRVIGDVARSGLGAQPFANLSFVEVGLFGKLLRVGRADLSKRCVEAKPVAQYNERSVYGGPKVVNHLPQKFIKN